MDWIREPTLLLYAIAARTTRIMANVILLGCAFRSGSLALWPIGGLLLLNSSPRVETTPLLRA